LNRYYGPGNAFYEDFCDLVKKGIDEGWAASGELDGPKYRRGRIALPCAETLFMSITTVFFDSKEVYAGQYHKVNTTECGLCFDILTLHSIHTERSTALFRSMTLSSWKVCLWARTGKARVGRASDQARITTLAQEVAEVWLFSFYPVAGSRTMLNRRSRSPRAFDATALSQ